MCGRFVMKEDAASLAELFQIDQVGAVPAASFNIAPTQQVAVVLESAKTGEIVRRLESARWSLVPSFATELSGKYPTFNARSESAAEKPMFRDSVRSMRALVPANGYYEWHTAGTLKTPYYIHPEAGEGMLAFAALFAWWRDPSKTEADPSRWVLSTTILTAPATGALAELHDRVPVLVAPEWWDTWLDPSEEGENDLVQATVAGSHEVERELSWYAVAPLKGDGPELIAPLEH